MFERHAPTPVVRALLAGFANACLTTFLLLALFIIGYEGIRRYVPVTDSGPQYPAWFNVLSVAVGLLLVSISGFISWKWIPGGNWPYALFVGFFPEIVYGLMVFAVFDGEVWHYDLLLALLLMGCMSTGGAVLAKWSTDRTTNPISPPVSNPDS